MTPEEITKLLQAKCKPYQDSSISSLASSDKPETFAPEFTSTPIETNSDQILNKSNEDALSIQDAFENSPVLQSKSQNQATENSAEPEDMDIDALADIELLNAINGAEKENSKENSHLLDSQVVRAENLAKYVEFLPNKNRYVVNNEKEDVYLINLQELTCTCKARQNCAHIMAVKIHLGLPIAKPKQITLTQLKKNARYNLRGGRKYRDLVPETDVPLITKMSVEVPNCVECGLDQVKGRPGKICTYCSKWVHNKCNKNHLCVAKVNKLL